MTDKVTVTWSDTLLTTDPGGTAAACRYYFSPTAYLEYDATNGAVHVVGAGLYSDSYVSALGANSSGGGGGGGASSLSELLDVTISSPSGGQVLTYSNGQWINAAIPTPSMTGYATESWVENNFASLSWIGQQGYLTSSSLNGYATQTWVNQQGFITSSSISDMATKTWVGQQGYLTSSSLSGYATQSWVNNQISDMATKTWVGQQGFLTSSAISDMATKTWVTNNFLGLHATADAATKLATARELWGQSFDGTAAVTGTLSYVGDINSNTNGNINNFNGIEMSYKAGSGHGGGIFFHWNGVTGYSSAYIYHDADNHINMFGHTAGFGVQVGSQNGDYLQIGAVRLMYDTSNNALKVIKSDGTAANLYATGGVSALGMSAGVSSVEAMTFGYLTVEHKISINDGDFESKIFQDASGNMVLSGSEGLKVESDLFIESNYVYADGVQANRFYLDSTRYLYVSGGTLYYYNGSTSKQVAFTN